MARNFRIREGHAVQFRGEIFNLPNHPNFGLPNGTVGAAQFGTIRSTSTSARQIQLALKYVF